MHAPAILALVVALIGCIVVLFIIAALYTRKQEE